jgi:hypothetical protein
VVPQEMLKTAQALDMYQGSKEDDDYVMTKCKRSPANLPRPPSKTNAAHARTHDNTRPRATRPARTELLASRAVPAVTSVLIFYLLTLSLSLAFSGRSPLSARLAAMFEMMKTEEEQMQKATGLRMQVTHDKTITATMVVIMAVPRGGMLCERGRGGSAAVKQLGRRLADARVARCCWLAGLQVFGMLYKEGARRKALQVHTSSASHGDRGRICPCVHLRPPRRRRSQRERASDI